MTPKFTVHSDFSTVPLDVDTWDALAEKANVAGVFHRYFWVRTWWKYYGHPFELYFVTAEDQGEVIGFAPFMIDESRTVRFIGDINSDYLGFVVPPNDTRLLCDFVEFLKSTKKQWRVLHLRNIPRSHPAHSTLADACRANRLFPWNNYSVVAPYLGISDNDCEVDRLLRKYSIRRSERQLSKQGGLSYEVFTTDERAAQFWTVFAQQHIDRWTNKGGSSSFSDPTYLLFLRDLYESDTSRKNVHFSGVFLDNSPIAFHFGFISQGRLLWYKSSFDEKIRRGSPGVQLISEMIRHAQRHNIGEIDFTIGGEPFKSRFCSEYRHVDEFRIHKSRMMCLADASYWNLRKLLKQIVYRSGTP